MRILTFLFTLWMAAGFAPAAAEGPDIGGPFSMTDMQGNAVTEASYSGKYLLVFFGFTHCPAVCPTSLLSIAHALDALGSEANKVQAIFVTVDPARDTPDVLASYVANFHPDIVGLTGSNAEVAAIAEAYRVYYARVDVPDSEAGYLMDHSAAIYLMGPNGQYLDLLRHNADPADIADAVRGRF
jgi:protein SCO1